MDTGCLELANVPKRYSDSECTPRCKQAGAEQNTSPCGHLVWEDPGKVGADVCQLLWAGAMRHALVCLELYVLEA